MYCDLKKDKAQEVTVKFTKTGDVSGLLSVSTAEEEEIQQKPKKTVVRERN